MNQLRIETFDYSDRAYADYVALNNCFWDLYPRTVRRERATDATRHQRKIRERFLAYTPDGCVGVAEFVQSEWAYDPGKGTVWIVVDPAHRNAGLGSLLHDHIMSQLRKYPIIAVETETDTRHQEAVRFIHQRDYTRETIENISQLDLAAVSFAEHLRKADQLAEAGYTFHRTSTLAQRTGFRKDYHAMACKLEADVPWHDAYTGLDFESYWRKVEAEDESLPEHSFVAMHNSQMVGMTELKRLTPECGLLHTGLTGVLRTHRKQGIARHLKALSLRSAQSSFATHRVMTENELNNPMFLLNVQLGFEKKFEIHYFTKQLTDQDR